MLKGVVVYLSLHDAAQVVKQGVDNYSRWEGQLVAHNQNRHKDSSKRETHELSFEDKYSSSPNVLLNLTQEEINMSIL
jgi:hypothetical protein